MKNADEKLTALWKSARTAAASDVSAEETFTPSIATRIASRWSSQSDAPTMVMLWERVAAGSLATVLIALVTTFWLAPAPAEPDLVDVLIHARFVIEPTAPPF